MEDTAHTSGEAKGEAAARAAQIKATAVLRRDTASMAIVPRPRRPAYAIGGKVLRGRRQGGGYAAGTASVSMASMAPARVRSSNGLVSNCMPGSSWVRPTTAASA